MVPHLNKAPRGFELGDTRRERAGTTTYGRALQPNSHTGKKLLDMYNTQSSISNRLVSDKGLPIGARRPAIR
jgi:hypothetical protein